MELIYTAQRDDFEPGRNYRNPRHFDQAEPGVESVVVIGDWPKVVNAYEKAGADVSVIDMPTRVTIVDVSDPAELKRLASELASIGVIVESFAEQSLDCPEGELGETAGRLLQVLEAVNAGIARLQRERDGEVQKVIDLEQEKADLLKQVEALKAATVDPEIEALKAVLDKAGVNYRANASKESLQKQVAELDNQ
ncbi:hypothetical protein SAMN05216487_3270 [Pseudomonas sp. UC 17F4]|uniref:hypothetical protein n=1 Tax=Pseudomonas sp. UC 17F4 TaxID=1855328 RepID=UPI000891E835|nr:hypothetical protein [Pseudomonas sp. UC 17F4]SDQ68539.1 hypothetical protein SAMN05216487_3270 [Pseudomonas sp. UC 17F4]